MPQGIDTQLFVFVIHEACPRRFIPTGWLFASPAVISSDIFCPAFCGCLIQPASALVQGLPRRVHAKVLWEQLCLSSLATTRLANSDSFCGLLKMFCMLFWVTLMYYLSRMPVSPVTQFEFLIILFMSNPGHHIKWLNCCLVTYVPDMSYHSVQKWMSPGGVFLTHGSRNSSVRCQSFLLLALDVSQVSWQQLEEQKSLIITITPASLSGLQAISFSQFFCHITELGVTFLNFNYRHSIWQLPCTLSCPLFSNIDPTCLGKIVKDPTCGQPSICLAESRCVVHRDSLGLWLWCSELWGDIESNRVFLLLASHCACDSLMSLFTERSTSTLDSFSYMAKVWNSTSFLFPSHFLKMLLIFIFYVSMTLANHAF